MTTIDGTAKVLFVTAENKGIETSTYESLQQLIEKNLYRMASTHPGGWRAGYLALDAMTQKVLKQLEEDFNEDDVVREVDDDGVE